MYTPYPDINARRQTWYTQVRQHMHQVVEPDGSARSVLFAAPYRSPVWILPALYTGSTTDIQLANAMAARYHTDDQGRCQSFNIFQTNLFAHCLHRFDKLLSDEARQVMHWHAELICNDPLASQRADFKFQGANDNMPMMATYGMIFAGEYCHCQSAIDHGIWNLEQLARQLRRSAWLGEFNSSTYTAITLSGAAKIASFSRTPYARELALKIEHRIWVELLAHFHPTTFLQAGPQSRAYIVDRCGGTHSLQMLYWLVLGDKLSGRDPIKTYFDWDGKEVTHFAGNVMKNAAEYCDLFDADFHLPDQIKNWMINRQYPFTVQGRAECFKNPMEQGAQYHTYTYMQPDYTLGTVNTAITDNMQTLNLYATYKHTDSPTHFTQAGTIFPQYLRNNETLGTLEESPDKSATGEKFLPNLAWCHAYQHQNHALLTAIPNPIISIKPISSLKLGLAFPCHYQGINRYILGKESRSGNELASTSLIESISIQTGNIYLYVQPLILAQLPCEARIRMADHNQRYQVLELVTYEGPERSFTHEQLSLLCTGMYVTIVEQNQFESLEKFHEHMSDIKVVDYYSVGIRNIRIQHHDIDFELAITAHNLGLRNACFNGLPINTPLMSIDQMKVDQLPFMGDDFPATTTTFPWTDSMSNHPANWPWMIGSHGNNTQTNYQTYKVLPGLFD